MNYYDNFDRDGSCRRCNSKYDPKDFETLYYESLRSNFTVKLKTTTTGWERCPVCDEDSAILKDEYVVREDGAVVATVATLGMALAVVKAAAPDAKRKRDYAWESERFLRQMEGWG